MCYATLSATAACAIVLSALHQEDLREVKVDVYFPVPVLSWLKNTKSSSLILSSDDWIHLKEFYLRLCFYLPFFFCILCLICLPEEEEKRKKKSPTWLSIVILDDVVITSAKWPSRKASRLLILPARAWSCFHCSTLFMLITPHSSVTRPGLCPAPCSCIFILLKCHRDCSDSNTHSDV